MTIRYTMDHERDPSGKGGTLLDFNGNTSFFRTNYVNANHKWIVSPNKLNELYLQVGQSFGDWLVHAPTLRNLSITGGFTLGGASNFPQGRTDYVYQLNDAFTWTLAGSRTGEHIIKTGAQLKIFKSNSFFDSNFRGTYTFSNLAGFLNGTPTRFTQNQGDSTLARPNQIFGFYFQDDWRPKPSLTLNLGLRYDFEGAKTEALKDVTGTAGPGISGDKNNVSPRLGFAWAPGASTKQVFYGGTGLYYDQVILNIIGNARFTPPKILGVQIDNPSWPDPFAGGTVQIPPPSLSIIDPDLKTGRNWNSQIGYRREILQNLGVDVSFVYNRGYDHVFIVNTNAGNPGTASFTGANPVRPDPTATNKSFYTNIGEITYKGLLVDVKKRFSRRFQGGVSYTLAKTVDNSFNFVSGVQVPERPDLNLGPGSDDRRHRVEGHAELNLPFDIQLGTIVEFRTEAPLNITAGGRDLNGDGITGDWVTTRSADREPASRRAVPVSATRETVCAS
ncbi:MAG: TonB-dependent receptor [Acidobacteria bacterium]|nr:TonB-dependent receptor [Acidobacteriota bacterium]